MPWLKKRETRSGTTYHLCDRINEKSCMIVNLGTWKSGANTALEEYKKAVALGYVYSGHPTTMAEIIAFKEARQKGTEITTTLKRLPIEDMCAFYLAKHGPSLKGGMSTDHRSQYYHLEKRLGKIARAWAGKHGDEITMYCVRDFLVSCTTVGTALKYLNTINHFFKSFYRWNKYRAILPQALALPPENPAVEWRTEMPSNQKKERPRKRVLTESEWQKLMPCLTKRARAICEVILRRFLRLSDIKQISGRPITGDFIEGLQEKTGEPFKIPVLGDHDHKYDFRNFRREFENAVVAAGLDYPKDHPLHFTMRDLRRTGATWAYRKTKDLVGISKMLGHTKITTTIRYLNIDDVDVTAIAAAVDAAAQSSARPKFKDMLK